MSDSDRDPPAINEQELREEDERRRQGKATLDEEIARRWDPSRLSKLIPARSRQV